MWRLLLVICTCWSGGHIARFSVKREKVAIPPIYPLWERKGSFSKKGSLSHLGRKHQQWIPSWELGRPRKFSVLTRTVAMWLLFWVGSSHSILKKLIAFAGVGIFIIIISPSHCDNVHCHKIKKVHFFIFSEVYSHENGAAFLFTFPFLYFF